VQLKPPKVLGCRRVGRALEKRRKPLAAGDVASLRVLAELARVHVLDHALTQRADGILTHGKLLSWMRFTTPRSSRQSVPSAIYDLSSRGPCWWAPRPPPRAIAQRLVPWPRPPIRRSAAERRLSEENRTFGGRRMCIAALHHQFLLRRHLDCDHQARSEPWCCGRSAGSLLQGTADRDQQADLWRLWLKYHSHWGFRGLRFSKGI